jgi:hypothetical protein
MSYRLKSTQLQLREDLEDLNRLREHIEQLITTYIKKQAALLRNVQEKGELQTVAVLAHYLKEGAKLRWGYRGWEVADTGVRVPTRIIEHLYGLGFARPEAEHGRHGLDDDRPDEIVDRLLSNNPVRGFRDNMSRRVFRANQNRAYFEYLNGLFALYQEHSVLRGAVSYPAVFGEKIRFTHHFAWLYFAGVLHWIGISEAFRMRIAQNSIEVITSLVG